MKLKLEPQKEFIFSEYALGKSVEMIANENHWYPQAVANLLKHYKLYNSYRPNQGNIRYFQSLDSPIKAYLLGFITADGCIQDNGNNSFGLTITIHEKDIQILHKIKEEIGCENTVKLIGGKMTHDKSKIKTHCRFQLFNNEFVSDISSYGITPKKSLTMPNILQNIPQELRKSFILGYFDGDGSVSFNKASNQLFVSFRGTKDFLQGIVDEICPSKYTINKDKQKNCYTLTFWRKADCLLFMQLYKELDFYLARKYNRFLDFFEISKDQTISPS